MKNILVIILAAVMIFSAISCQADTTQQRSAMLDYLRSANVILNSLPQASEANNPVKDLNAFNQQQAKLTLAKNIKIYQEGLQKVQSELVPDIADAKSFHQTALSLVGDTAGVLLKMQTALNSGSQDAWAQSVDDYMAHLPRVPDFYRLIESLLSKYAISDAEVDYRFRGK
jgi:hypothetical protein